jgi:P pilus assembly protein, pilin FimA
VNNMKKLLVAAILSSASFGAFAYDAQVNFNGEVVDQTCKINGSASPATVTITLDKVGVSAFKSAGDWAGNKLFTLKLTECTAATTTVKWEPMVNVDSATGALKNTTTTNGSNVQVRVLNDDYSPINMTQDAGRTFSGASANLDYYAQYYAKVVPATAGQVATYGYITLTY